MLLPWVAQSEIPLQGSPYRKRWRRQLDEPVFHSFISGDQTEIGVVPLLQFFQPTRAHQGYTPPIGDVRALSFVHSLYLRPPAACLIRSNFLLLRLSRNLLK